MSVDSGFTKAFEDGAANLLNEANAIRKRQFIGRCLLMGIAISAMFTAAWWLHSVTVDTAVAKTKAEVNETITQETDATLQQYSAFAATIDELYTSSFEEVDHAKLESLLHDLNKAAWVLNQANEDEEGLLSCLKAASRSIEISEQLEIPLRDSWQYYDTYALASYRFWVNKQKSSGDADSALLDQAIEKQTVAVDNAPINVVPNLKARLREYKNEKERLDSTSLANGSTILP